MLALAPEPNEEPDEIRALRQRLKLDARTKPSMLAAAVALAQDTDAGRDPAKVFRDHSIPSGSQGRAKALAARIVSLPAAAAPASWLPGNALLLQANWIQAHASSVAAVTLGALVVADDGQHAARPIYARFIGSDVSQADEVVYDLVLRDGETHKARDDKHRRREEGCIRRLDGAAAGAHRAKRAREQRSRRADEEAVRGALEHVIVQLERQAQQEARAERQRARAERAKTQRLKKKRCYRRAALSHVGPCDFDTIDAVDDTLDYELEAEEAEEALAGDAGMVWSSDESGDQSGAEDQSGGEPVSVKRLSAVERERRILEMEEELRSMEDGGLNGWGQPNVPLNKFSAYTILKKEVHQLDTAGWMRGMPEDVKCKCSLCRLAFEDCQKMLAIRTENLEMNPASGRGQQEAEHCEKLLEVLYHFPPKKRKHVRPFDWQCMMY